MIIFASIFLYLISALFMGVCAADLKAAELRGDPMERSGAGIPLAMFALLFIVASGLQVVS